MSTWFFTHTRCTPFTCVQCNQTFLYQWNFIFGQEGQTLRLETEDDLRYFAEQALNREQAQRNPSPLFLLRGQYDSSYSFGIGDTHKPIPILCRSCYLSNARVIGEKLGISGLERISELVPVYQPPTQGIFS